MQVDLQENQSVEAVPHATNIERFFAASASVEIPIDTQFVHLFAEPSANPCQMDDNNYCPWHDAVD